MHALLALTVASTLVPPAHAGGDDAPRQEGLPFLVDAFAAFDASTSPATPGEPAATVLAPWLAYLDPDVDFLMNDAPARIGHDAVAEYFAPLLPLLGTTQHELLSITPVQGEANAWLVVGVLHIARLSDGRAITPIPFTDTLTIHSQQVVRYEISLDPTPLGELFAP